jgi:hypothetical protein
MSAIKDALSRVQQQRKEIAPTKSESRSATRRLTATNSNTAARTPLYVWILGNLAVLGLVFAGYFLFFREARPANQLTAATPPAPRFIRPESPSIPAAGLSSPIPVAASRAESPRVALAPEAPAIAPRVVSHAPDIPPADGEYELSGMTAVGATTLLSITRRSDRSSFWITVGKTVGEVTAVSYSPETNDARIQVRGRLVTIRRR